MKRKITSCLVAICLLSLALVTNVFATEIFTYDISASTTTPIIGSEFEVTISLTNYDTLEEEIRGLQIDVKNIDPNVLEVVSHTSLLTDDAAASNQTSYSSKNNYVRYVYLKLSGTMEKNTTNIMKIRFKVKENLTDNGSITLPITLKIGTQTDNITILDELTINYTALPTNIVSIDIFWGNMQFIYDDGTWDTESHKWVNNGWKPYSDNGNLIIVSNNGNVDVNARLSYTPNDGYQNLSGTFVDETGSVITLPLSLVADGSEEKLWFNLFGTTDNRWDNEFVAVGKITLTVIEME